jgi:hypothetical protein
MSLFVKLMIGGWITTFVMFGFCALHESGRMLKIRKRIALWLEPSVPTVVRTPAGGLLFTSPRLPRSTES